MNSFVLFFRKEIAELIKTVKGIVFAVIFLVIGISSPLITKLTPEIIKLAGIEASAEEMDVLTAIIPKPDSVESYKQFFSNFNSIGLLALIIVFAGIVSNEKNKNTAAYILTQNISRRQFILSKFVASVVFTFVSLVISMAAQIFYTKFLFDDNLIELKYIIIYSALLFLYLFFILSIVIFSSVVTKTVTSSTFVAFLIFIAANIFSAIPKIGKYMPPNINDISVLLQLKSAGDLTVNIIITAVCSIIFIIAGLELFNRQEL